MEVIMRQIEGLSALAKSGVAGAGMVDLAVLLQQCGTSEYDSDELISFVDDIDEDTGEVTTVKVVL